jgi:hypothetical protein
MKIKTLQLRRDLVLMAYEAGRMSKETAQAKCRVLTRAIESMAKMQDEQMKEQIKAAK